MRNLIAFTAAVLMSAACSYAKFVVDAVHSAVVFRISHMGVSQSYGVFDAPTGSYLIDMANPSASSIDITIDANKVHTGNEKRDEHLRSPDFFNTKQFPTMRFVGKSFEKQGEKTLKVMGELTMLDATKPVEVVLEYIGEGETRQGYKSGFEATFTIKRSEFGMTKFLEGNALGDEVRLIVSVEGKKESQ